MQQGNKLIIHEEHIIHNFNLIQDNYHSEYPLYAVVKSNAYGHGLFKTVEALYEMGHRHFGVFHISEAIPLRKQFSDIHIMLMGDFPMQYAGDISKFSIEPAIFSYEKWRRFLAQDPTVGHFHVMLESGLNRMGIKDIQNSEFIQLAKLSREAGHELSFYSHISAAPEGPDEKRVKKQYEIFDEQVAYIRSEIDSYKYFHFYNSANLPFYQEHRYGARVGLLLYGYSPLQNNSSIPWLLKLKPVMEYRSWIMQIKTVSKDDYIGYGLHYQCPTEKQVGYVPIGYADGFFRNLGNKGKVLTEYGYASILGIVNMNLIAIDLSSLPLVRSGDEVIILGQNNIESITADDHAIASGTIPYEVLTSLGNQVNYGIPF